MTCPSHSTCLRFGLLTFIMGIIIQLRFKDSFKAKGEAIRPVFPRNARNALAFSEPQYVNHALSLAHVTSAALKTRAMLFIALCLCRCSYPLCLNFPNFLISRWSPPTLVFSWSSPSLSHHIIVTYLCPWLSQRGRFFLGAARMSYSSLYP